MEVEMIEKGYDKKSYYSGSVLINGTRYLTPCPKKERMYNMKGTKFVLVLMMVISLVVIPSFQGSNTAEASSSAFKIAVIPDTQIYSMRHPEIFKAQTQWIADNWEKAKYQVCCPLRRYC